MTRLSWPVLDVWIDRLSIRASWIVLGGAVAFGVWWRAAQYGLHASLASDELALARNITDRTVSGLFERLEFGQVAPIGFLLALKASASLFGATEWSLRLVPLLAGLAAIPLFWLVARRTLRDEVAAAVATALVAVATPLAVWSVILKPYAFDVVCALAVVAVSQTLLDRELRRSVVVRAVLVGAVTALFSHAVVFVLAACGGVLLGDALFRRRRDDFMARALVVGAWGTIATSMLLWTYFLGREADHLYMRRFWESFFMPSDWRLAVQWTGNRFIEMFQGGPWPDGQLAYSRPKAWILLLACGGLALMKRRPPHALLFIGPLVLAFAAAAARQYPFGSRTSLYLVPSVILLVVAGVQGIASMAGRSAAAVAPFALVPLAVVAMLRYPPSFKPEDMRPPIEYLSSHRRPGDAVWVYYGAGQGFMFYARNGKVPLDDVVFGVCDRTDPRANLRQVDAMRGRNRAWIVLSHIVPEERHALIGYLNAIGTPLDMYSPDARTDAFLASTIHLYRLDDPERLRRASADSVSVTPIVEPAPWSCYGPMSATPGSERVAVEALERDARK